MCRAVITIDSVRTTVSTCANNGTITVYTHGGTTVFYALTSGPNIRPQQSSVQFSSLPPGTYVILVTDFLNDSLTATATVGGHYTPPAFTATFAAPGCPSASTGYIAGHASTGGTPPYTWSLTNTGTGLTTTQSTDSFPNLPAGSYSLRESDSCGNFATYSVTLLATADSFSFNNIINYIYPCDSVKVGIVLNTPNAHYSAPYTITVQTHNGTYSHIITNIVLSANNPYLSEMVHGVSYGDYINITITDACGRSIYKANTVAAFFPKYNFNAVPDSCMLRYVGYFYLPGDSAQSNVNTTYFPDPVTVITSNAATGALIDSVVNTDSPYLYSQYAYTLPEVGNLNYKVKIIDGCGNVYNYTIPWPVNPPPSLYAAVIRPTCKDSTACYELQWQNTFFSKPTFELISGPSTIGSTKPKYVYHDTIIYPHFFPTVGTTNAYFIELTNLGAGTYHYRVFDSCGNSYTDSFTITTQNLNNDQYTLTTVRGCPGQNTIIVKNDAFCNDFLLDQPLGNVTLSIPTDTLINLNSGSYIFSFQYTQPFWAVAVDQNPACQVILDTVTIAPYQPPQVSYATQISCHGSMQVVFQPDSSTGVFPYKYEIISGPQTTGLQYSNVVSLSQPGLYIARVIDSCGFASTFSFTVDTLSFAAIVKVGSSCLGLNATLSGQHSPYATYIWHSPGGAVYIGDSFVISPILAADFGTYTVSKVVNVNGCRDTINTSYVFSGDTITQTYASICPGQSIVFGGIGRSAAGVYYDTIPRPTCDSIVALHLIIKGPVYDSVSQVICPGQKVTVGTHIYNATGLYRDTFVTAGCDSIHILNLLLNPYKLDTISTVICPGQSLLFGGLPRSLPGSYYDTIPTSGCDSIVLLNLSIRGPLYDSVFQTICAGQSVTIGAHTYTATGIYRDTMLTSGCDSVHVLNLHVTPYGTSSVSVILCPGQAYTFGTNTLSLAGVYYDTIPTTGCDSIVTLQLSIRGPLYDSLSQTICAGQSVTIGTHTYTGTGIYRDTFLTSGCDSVHVLDLHVTPYGTGSVSTILCPGQTLLFGGRTLTTAGIYYDTIPTTGCDSIVTLHLSFRTPLYDSTVQNICTGQSVSVGVHTYSMAGIYYDTIATVGCDSIHVLNLSVTPFKTGSSSVVICPGAIYLFGSNTLSLPGIYYDTLATATCDSIVTLTLSIRGPLYDSVSQTICAGQSVSVGAHTYTTGGIYYDTIATAGCDSIHVLNLTVTPYSTGTASVMICPGSSFVFGTNTLTQPGTYYDTIPTTGCDSIVTLTLSIRGPLYDSVLRTICAGQSVSIGGHNYSASGIYYDTIATAGCDSIHVLNLTVTPYSTGTASVVICPGSSFVFGANTLTQAGTYFDTIPTTGCDSIVTLTLSIRGPLYDSAVQNICAGQTVSVGVHTYSTAGIYYDTIATVGCDSIHVLNLSVTPFKTGSSSVVICPGATYLFGSNTLSLPGIYYDTLATATCDSIVTLTLSIRGPLYDSISQTICAGQSVIVGTHTYIASGIYYDTIPTAGCDSTHVLNLTVTPYSTGTASVVICPGSSFVFGTNTLTQPGTYYDTIPTTGCDSIVTLTLSIRGPLYDSVLRTICAGQSVSIGGHNYSASGIYYDTIATAGCDSIHVLNLTVSPYIRSSRSESICLGQHIIMGSHTYTTSGTYIDTIAASAGCDSIITIRLTVISPVAQSIDTGGICAMIYRGQIYQANATLHDTMTSAAGCDSIYLSVNIHIAPPADSITDQSACIYSGQTYTIGGQSHSAPGIYSDTLRTVLGDCDSLIINTSLRVISPRYVNAHIDSCYSATVGGVTYTSDTVLRDTLFSSCGLDSIISADSIHLYAPSMIIVSSSQLPILAGQSVQLTISPPGNYQDIVWSPDYYISNSYSPEPIVSPREDTTYYVTAETIDHCLVSAQILVTVAGADQPDFLMPTAFSPNGDGNNDIYRPVIKNGPLDVLSFLIYDRWGHKVYDKEIDGGDGWNGTYKNVKQPISVYIYYITAKISTGNIVKQSGNLTLIR